MIREHESAVTSYGAVEVAVGITEHATTGMGTPVVRVYSNDMADLTEAEAHELGLAIVRAGDVVRRFARQAANQ